MIRGYSNSGQTNRLGSPVATRLLTGLAESRAARRPMLGAVTDLMRLAWRGRP